MESVLLEILQVLDRGRRAVNLRIWMVVLPQQLHSGYSHWNWVFTLSILHC